MKLRQWIRTKIYLWIMQFQTRKENVKNTNDNDDWSLLERKNM
jgi:hypothetical protein